MQGFLGLRDDVPVGYREIRVTFRIDADISEETKEELIALAQQYSPVFNTITRPVPVRVELEKS